MVYLLGTHSLETWVRTCMIIDVDSRAVSKNDEICCNLQDACNTCIYATENVGMYVCTYYLRTHICSLDLEADARIFSTHKVQSHRK